MRFNFRVVGFFVFLFLSFLYLSWIRFDEEVLFLLTFSTIVLAAYRSFSVAFASYLDGLSNGVYREVLIFASAKALGLGAVKSFSREVVALERDLDDVAAFVFLSVERSMVVCESDFINCFQLLKHKQLKLLVLEGLQLTRAFFVKRFLSYWNDVRSFAATGAYGVVFEQVALEASVFEYPALFDFSTHVSTDFVFSSEENFDSVSFFDLLRVSLLLRSLLAE
jgi:hypothetical protein